MAEHIVPVGQGGERSAQSNQSLCWSCRLRKSAKEGLMGKRKARDYYVSSLPMCDRTQTFNSS